MSGERFRVFECRHPECGFRCPISPTDPILEKCPLCGNAGSILDYDFPGDEPSRQEGKITLPRVEVLLDNIRSIYNVGSIFRTCDGAGVSKIYLGGYTPTPDHPKLKKTGLGSEWHVGWESVRNGLKLAKDLQSRGAAIWSLERQPTAQSIFDLEPTAQPDSILLVVGNEKVGIDPEILRLSDRIISIPMAGYKRSLNVASAFGVAAYILMRDFG